MRLHWETPWTAFLFALLSCNNSSVVVFVLLWSSCFITILLTKSCELTQMKCNMKFPDNKSYFIPGKVVSKTNYHRSLCQCVLSPLHLSWNIPKHMQRTNVCLVLRTFSLRFFFSLIIYELLYFGPQIWKLSRNSLN